MMGAGCCSRSSRVTTPFQVRPQAPISRRCAPHSSLGFRFPEGPAATTRLFVMLIKAASAPTHEEVPFPTCWSGPQIRNRQMAGDDGIAKARALDVLTQGPY